MTDSPITQADKPVHNPEVHDKLTTDSTATPGSMPAPDHAANDAHVQAGTLPALSIDGVDSGNSHFGSGAMAVTGDLLTGAGNELTQHPGQVGESLAIGVGTGLAAGVVADGVVAVAAGVGLTLTAPAVLAGAAILGAGYGAYELYEHAGSWFDAGKVVSDQNDYSPTQVAQAHAELQGVGAGGLNVVAGLGGVVAGNYMAGAIAAAAADAPAVVAPATTAPALDGTTALTPPADVPATVPPAGATPPIDAPPTPPSTVPAQPGHAALAPVQPAAVSGDSPAVSGDGAAAAQPGDSLGAIARPGEAPVATQPGDGPAAAPASDAPGEKPATGDAQPAEAAPIIDLANPAGNTNEPALAKALQDAIQAAKADGQPVTFTVDNTVNLTDAAGNPIKTTQAQVLYQELEKAYPENQFVFSKPDLNPGDPGYTEFPAQPVTQDDLHISSKESPITLASDTTLPDGTVLPAGSKFAVGTTYDGDVVKSALPDGKVWATKPDGTYVQVAGEGQSTTIPSDALSTDPKQIGQVVNIKNSEGVQNNILVRSDAKAVDPDGKPLLDAYPVTDDTLNGAYKPGTQPGYYAPLAKSADHFKLPSNMTVVTQMGKSDVTASGSDGYYFMKSGYGDAPDATAKNYSGVTRDAQSAAELARLRAEQGLS
jgi:hypothetical protein